MASIFSYAKTLWQDGVTAITAARLNHIEQGISDAADSIKTLGDSVSQGDTDTDDFNKVVEPGCYIIGSLAQNAANCPNGAQTWGVLTVHAGQPGGYLMQVYSDSYGKFWVRSCWAGNWYPWVKIGS